MGSAEKKARLGEAGLGKGGNLGMGSIYLFFFAFFFAAIGFSPPVWKIEMRANAKVLGPGASVAQYVVASAQIVKKNFPRPTGGSVSACSIVPQPRPISTANPRGHAVFLQPQS